MHVHAIKRLLIHVLQEINIDWLRSFDRPNLRTRDIKNVHYTPC